MLVICSAPVISPLLFNCFLRFSHLLYFIKHHQKPLLLLPLVDFFLVTAALVCSVKVLILLLFL
jgi:hypothetical protein